MKTLAKSETIRRHDVLHSVAVNGVPLPRYEISPVLWTAPFLILSIRPQFARDEWLKLNGGWKFRIDDQSLGLELHYRAEIQVSFSLESAISGIGDPSFHPSVWYQRVY
jgi:hypothetical protein